MANKPKTPAVNPTKDQIWPKPKEWHPFTWIGPDDRKLARKVLDIVRKNKSTALDTEFPTQGPRKDECIIWGLSGAPEQRFVFDAHWMRDKNSPYVEWMADKKTKLVYFSFPADADVIEKNAGVDINASFYSDVKVLGWLRNNNKRRHALKEEEADYLKIYRHGYKTFGYYPEGKNKWEVISPDRLMEGPLPDEMLEVMPHADWIELFKHYNGCDVYGTHSLHRVHKAVLKRWGYWQRYLELDQPYTVTLRKFQARGIPIDFDALNRLDLTVTSQLVRHRTVLRELAGKPDLKLASSATDLRKLIFEEWEWPTYEDLMTEPSAKHPDGQAQLNKIAWSRYATDEGFSFARLMLPYNKLKTLKGTFINGVRYGVKYGPGAATNTLFSEYNQTGTKTGRMSSRKFYVDVPTLKTFKRKAPVWVVKKEKAGMNMLNFPNKQNDLFGVRQVVCAPPPDEFAPEGYDLVVSDFSGFELWMILYWCLKWGIKSEMFKHLNADEDVHSMSAIACLGMDPKLLPVFKEKYKQLRDTIGKRSNFGLGYGAGVRVFMAILGYDQRKQKLYDKAELLRERWYNRWPEMKQYQDKCVSLGYKQGWVPTIADRRIWVAEGLESSDDGTVRHYENLCKSGPAQGSAADITKYAQNEIEKHPKLKAMHYRQFFNVYDEIVGAAPKRYAKQCLEIQNDCMKSAGAYFKLPFVLRVEGSTAYNWWLAK